MTAPHDAGGWEKELKAEFPGKIRLKSWQGNRWVVDSSIEEIIEGLRPIIAQEREAVARGMVVEKRSCESYDGEVDDNCDECAGCRQNAARSEQIRWAKELGVSIEE